ncbi:DUF3159 domain-containing protein [Streptodolium elevatio]
MTAEAELPRPASEAASPGSGDGAADGHAAAGTGAEEKALDRADDTAGGAHAAPAGDGTPDSAMSLVAAFGGVRGMIDMTVPGLVFVVVFTITRTTATSAYAAVAVAAVLAGIRLMRRETLMHALGGFLGVAIAAFVAIKSGKAENFYLLGVLLSGGYAVAYMVSILVRWPLIGVVLGPILGENFTWRKNPARAAAYTKATWVWVALFVLRIVVQVPLYLADKVTWLGAAKVALGVPPWLVAIYLTWLIMSKAPPPVKVTYDDDRPSATGSESTSR